MKEHRLKNSRKRQTGLPFIACPSFSRRACAGWKSELSFDLFSCVHFFLFVWPEHSRLYLLYNIYIYIYGDVTVSRSKFRKTAHACSRYKPELKTCLQRKLIFCLHSSYYELTKPEEPSVYTMETHEIIDKLESIVSETLPKSKTGGKWERESIIDIVLKYKVIILLSTKLILGVCHFIRQFSRVFLFKHNNYVFSWMFFLVRYLTDVTRSLVSLYRITS